MQPNKRTRALDVKFDSIGTVKLVKTVWVNLGLHAWKHIRLNPGIMKRLYKQLGVGSILQSDGVYIVRHTLRVSRTGWNKYYRLDAKGKIWKSTGNIMRQAGLSTLKKTMKACTQSASSSDSYTLSDQVNEYIVRLKRFSAELNKWIFCQNENGKSPGSKSTLPRKLLQKLLVPRRVLFSGTGSRIDSSDIVTELLRKPT
jgi:hypothetical protein